MKTRPKPYRVEVTSRNVLTLHFDEVNSKSEFWFLLSADRHHDNQHANHKLERKHLEQARERQAGVFDFGDLFCAMQGKWDKRADQSQLRKELRGNNYLDLLVNYNSEFFGNYADQFELIGVGNHETSILKHHQTNLTERLIERVAAQTGRVIPKGGYSGWVRFLFRINGTVGRSKKLFYHHGYGGDAPVTKGTIQTARMSVYTPDADIVVSGHTHNEWIFPIQRVRLSNKGVPYQDEQTHVKVPGYKDEYEDGYGGWHIERGAPPKPNGAAWLRMWAEDNEMKHEIIRAK
jgi:hypothetical protein